MLRTTVYLNEGEVLAIRRLSIIRRCPQAEIIREAIRRYIDNTKDELKQSLPPGIGAYKSGRLNVSQNADDLLRRSKRKKRATDS